MKKYKRLTKDERNQIEILHNLKYSNREIAGVLRRSPNTISYEIKRVPSGYRADYAQIYARKAEMNRRYQWRKLNHYSELNRYVTERLKRKWSPDIISGRMKEEKRNFFVSGKSIYSWLNCVEGERYQKHLYKNRTGRSKAKKRTEYLGIKGLVSIHERPKEIWNRTEEGHWETDLVESNRSGTGALSTSSERVSKYINAQYVKNKTGLEKQKTLANLQSEFIVKSITFDRGTENALHRKCNIPTYFCDSYNSGQKGGIENSNKMIRRYFRKGTDFSKISNKKLQKVIKQINNQPRKILGYKTSFEVATEMGLFRNRENLQEKRGQVS